MRPLLKSTAVSPWMARSARIIAVHPETPGVITIDLGDDAATASGERFTPGQFNMLYLPGFGESAISISSDPASRDVLSHTVRIAGNVTRELAKRRAGDKIALRGPFGSSWPVNACGGKDVVIACGGIGLVPLRPAIYHLLRHRNQYGRLILLYGARTPNDLLYTAEYAEWRAQGLEIETTVDIGDEHWQGNIGVVPLLFYRLRLAPQQTIVMTCGPEIMIRFVVFEALARRVRPEDVYLSMERNMSCAMGLCGRCQFGPYFVCKDGPVFSFRQVEPYFVIEDF